MNKRNLFVVAILLASGCTTNRISPQNQTTDGATPEFVVKPAETKFAVPESDKKKYVDFGLTRDKSGEPNFSFYLIKSSVARKGDIAEAKILANAEMALRSNGKTVLSAITVMDFDCKGMRQSRRTMMEAYSLPFGKGDKISSVNYLEQGKSDWETAKPDSMGMRWLKSACYLSDKDAQSKKTSPPPVSQTNRTTPDSFLKSLREEEMRAAAQKDQKARTSQDGISNTSYISKLRNKIKSNVVLPKDIEGNPASIFRITQLPSGEIIDVQLVQSSGNKQLDIAVERAIRKSSPLPIPEVGKLDRIIDITYTPF